MPQSAQVSPHKRVSSVRCSSFMQMLVVARGNKTVNEIVVCIASVCSKSECSTAEKLASPHRLHAGRTTVWLNGTALRVDF